MLRFAVAFFLVAGALFALYTFPYAESGFSERWFTDYLSAYARLAGPAPSVVEPGVTVHGQSITGRFSLEIVKSCDAMEVFVARFACLLAIYLAPWPGFGAAYGRAASAVGNLVVDGAGAPSARLSFARSSARGWKAAYDVDLTATDTESGAVVRVAVDLRTLTYAPTAVYVALAVAAPVWTSVRAFAAFAAGLAALQAFLALSVAAPLVLFFSQGGPMPLVVLSPWSRALLDVFYRPLVVPPGMVYAIPLLVWLLSLCAL